MFLNYNFQHELGNHYINISGSNSLDISGKGISIGFWVKPLASDPLEVHNFKDYAIVNKPWNFNQGQGDPPYQYSMEIYNGVINKIKALPILPTNPVDQNYNESIDAVNKLKDGINGLFDEFSLQKS